MTALPSVAQVQHQLLIVQEDNTALSLYSTVILPAEKAANKADHIVYARVVGYLFLYPPNSTARATLKLEVAFCNTVSDDNDRFKAVYDLGMGYVRNLIRIFRKSRGKTPVPSSHLSRPSFDKLKQDILKSSPRNHSDAKDAALVRDDHRCVLTRMVDRHSLREGLAVQRWPEEPVVDTRCSHIFPDSLGSIEAGESGNEEHQVGTVWTILQRFGYEDVYNELKADQKGTGIHRLNNILTLAPTIQGAFDDMELWLEAIPDKANHYRVVLAPYLAHKSLDHGLQENVQFVVHGNCDLPLPNPRCLSIHAACCRIAHMSGAAKYLDVIFRDMEELDVLAEDGASAEVLTYALHRLVERGRT
ncbi:uncharacterized protein C8Q71DRAFT_718745 [Rhodofomes roseus]|uniref:HNH nuclease domain-containing protein n=1 Tax=Rhodofomes roseus TaxID=34475 RepID=A0ABQ8JXU1_9APHY|nr:uncharacterized protein C8Q71DRAFT_718745 [Rhodofomes roseus]KAH9829044.1 hypothetical protein C8Q71DRAFT_718745 [Rhodofomes roseus]